MRNITNDELISVAKEVFCDIGEDDSKTIMTYHTPFGDISITMESSEKISQLVSRPNRTRK